jgi:pilus assembly protein CpaE
MVHALSLGLVIETQSLWDEAQKALHDLPARIVMEAAGTGEVAVLIEKLQARQPEAILLDVAPFGEGIDEAISKIKAALPNLAVIAIHRTADPVIILKAIRGGASEFLYSPIQDHLSKALERVAAGRTAQTGGAVAGGKVVALLSAKGGCGATTIACHLAQELHRHTNGSILLADLDLSAGMIGFLMKSKSTYSVIDAVRNVHRLDPSYWKALVSNGFPGIEVISAPAGVTAPAGEKPEDLRKVLRFARHLYDWTVADLGRSLGAVALGALEEADQTVVVTTLEVPAMHHAKRIIHTILQAGYNRERLRLVLNRMPKRSEVTPEEIEAIVGLPIHAMLPNDYPALYEAYADGKLLEEGSNLRSHISRLAMKLAGLEEKKKKRFSLLG